ncbi:MAG: HAD hydrolase-like protein [Kiritimatiellae bacterium]|nr:HAD hydrolase-like protein [Kiritimatiellia bacterium]
MRKHWFFDFDGTLCETEEDIKNAWRLAIKGVGRECARFDEIYKTGPTLEQVAYMLFDDCTPQLVEEIRKQFVVHYDSSTYPNSKPYPWILPWLDTIKKLGGSIYILTNKRWTATIRIARVLGWEKYFDDVLTFDMYTSEDNPTDDDSVAGKKLTKAEMLSYQMKIKGISKDDAVMVGDTVGDVTAGVTAGTLSVGVTWGYGTREELSEADVILDKDDFLDIGKLGKKFQ